MSRKTLKKFTELAQFELAPTSIQMLPLAFCSRNQLVVLGKVDLSSQDVIHLGMLEPSQDELVQALAVRWARPVVAVQLNQYEINKALDAGFGTGLFDDREFKYMLDLASPPAGAKSPAVELVDDILLSAIAQRASDIGPPGGHARVSRRPREGSLFLVAPTPLQGLRAVPSSSCLGRPGVAPVLGSIRDLFHASDGR